MHYNPAKELFLGCDASPYGVGAVLSHRIADRSMKPIAYASRLLNPAEKRYSQLDKEGLAIVFGVKKFHHYLFGRTFTICSDHKPLQHLFSESRPIPQLASARIQRWALTLTHMTTPLSSTQALRWAMLIPSVSCPFQKPQLRCLYQVRLFPHGNIVHLTFSPCITRSLHPNAEFQLLKPPVWPRFSNSNHCIYIRCHLVSLSVKAATKTLPI